MLSQRKCLNFYAVLIVLTLSVMLSSVLSGCILTEGLRDSPKIIVVNYSEVPLDVNEPAPFTGVLSTFDRFDYLLRCENYVLQKGISP